jgi:hypothetical protein
VLTCFGFCSLSLHNLSKADSQLSFYKKPAQGVAKKKDQLMAQLAEQDEEKADLEAQLRDLDKQIQVAFGTFNLMVNGGSNCFS